MVYKSARDYMENRNIALAALFDALTRNGISHDLLIAGTDLKLEDLKDLKKRHSWETFLILYKNLGMILGEEKAAREVAYTGIYNKELSSLRAIGTGFIDVKTIYWYLATFACRHLFCDNVIFKYKKINSNKIQMEVIISPELKTSQLLLKTYIYLWENIPTLLGLPKANVTAEMSTHSALYTVSMQKTSYWLYYFSRLRYAMTGYSNAVLLMEELESQSIQLRNALEEKSQLLKIISHDISNSVTVIDHHLGILLKKQNPDEEERQHLLKARTSSKNLISILQNIKNLEVSQIKGVHVSPLDVDESFKVVIDSFQHKLQEKKLEVEIHNLLPKGAKVLAEKSSFELNVLSNLLSNAIKFSSVGCKIIFNAELEDKVAVISVIDSGCGISEDEKRNLFAKKIRKSTKGTMGEKGTGLGLGIVKHYMNLYNGHVSVEDNSLSGAIFKLYLQAELPDYSQNGGLFKSKEQ